MGFICLHSLIMTHTHTHTHTKTHIYITYSQCRGLSNVKFQVMDALAMEWPDNSFDLVWACESGEHMPDKKKYVEEMVRVLKPGGTLVIACWCQREEGDKCVLTASPQ